MWRGDQPDWPAGKPDRRLRPCRAVADGSLKFMSNSNVPAGVASTSVLKRWAPLIVLLAAMAFVFAMGWHKFLSFKTIGLNYDALKFYISEHLALSLGIYLALYAGIVALSLPVGLIMTLAGGLLFGWKIGAPATVIAATTGSGLVFLIVNTSFGATLADKAGPFVAKLRDGFKENALSYLLFLRLVPVFPFFIVNLVPALLGVPLRTFLIGTALGIIPATTAYSLAGSGLGSVIEAQNAAYKACLAAKSGGGVACDYDIDLTQIITRELVWAGVALGLVALIPVAMKYWSQSHAKG
jgi:uncharacterized membrane protein YdjX (TVP38/TMEM64 family)